VRAALLSRQYALGDDPRAEVLDNDCSALHAGVIKDARQDLLVACKAVVWKYSSSEQTLMFHTYYGPQHHIQKTVASPISQAAGCPNLAKIARSANHP
jgi:hypothetical protein